MDIAFGMLCAKKVFEDEFCGFDDMRSEFLKLRRENPLIDYDNIDAIYEEIASMNYTKLPMALGVYLKRHLHPKMNAELALSRYFDTEKKRIMEVIF